MYVLYLSARRDIGTALLDARKTRDAMSWHWMKLTLVNVIVLYDLTLAQPCSASAAVRYRYIISINAYWTL